jgi:hypothetical protein
MHLGGLPGASGGVAFRPCVDRHSDRWIYALGWNSLKSIHGSDVT